MFAILAIGTLVACEPEVTYAAPTDSPAVTQKATPTIVLSSTPTTTPKVTPEPTPEMTREEALRKLNITSDMMFCMADPIVYECTLKNGDIKHLVLYTSPVEREDGTRCVNMRNMVDDEIFAKFITSSDSVSFYDTMDLVDIELVPEFLQGATINTTYQLRAIPWLFYGEPGDPPLPKTESVDMIMEMQATDPNMFLDRVFTSEDMANIILDFIPLENMVWASDYIKGFEEAPPKQK